MEPEKKYPLPPSSLVRLLLTPSNDKEEEEDDPDKMHWDNVEDYKKAVEAKEMRDAQNRIEKVSDGRIFILAWRT